MANIFTRFLKGIVLKPETSNPSEQVEGSVYHNGTANRLGTFIEALDREIVTDTQTQTLENKSIDADQNTITNIENADIKALAAIDATKIADGSIDNTEFQYLNGVTSNIQTQIDSKANRFLSNLSSPTAINQDLLPDSDATRDIGADNNTFASIYADEIRNDDSGSSINLVSSQISDSSAAASFNYENRQLLSGATVKLDYSGTNIDINTRKIVNVVDPSAAQDAATKNYADTTFATQVALAAHINDTSDAHDASAISYDNTVSGLTATEVQAAIDELTATGGGANKFLSNLTSPTSINQDLLPNSNITKDIGSGSFGFKDLFLQRIFVKKVGGAFNSVVISETTTPSGSTSKANFQAQSLGGGTGIAITSATEGGSDNSNPVSLESGNTVNGNSGDISLRPGVPTGSGTKGKIDANSSIIKNVLDPLSAQDAATKAYVDAGNTFASANRLLKSNGSSISEASGILIDSSNVMDFAAGQAHATIQTLTDGATINWNLNGNQNATVTLGGNRALANPTNMKSGAVYTLIVKQDGAGGRTLSYGSSYKWASGVAPTLSTGINDVDILTFISDGTNMYGVIQQDFS